MLRDHKTLRDTQSRNGPKIAAMRDQLGRKQRPAKLSPLVGFEAVGLGIVAAMSASGSSPSPRSEPIPIASPRPVAETKRPVRLEEEEEEMEMSESYTCVISHVGGQTKKVYFNDGGAVVIRRKVSMDPEVVLVESPASTPVAEFLRRCCLCGKRLLGMDIFMYRGDKAFCSVECRRQQMISDDRRALKPYDSSVSPCSAPKFLSPAALTAA